jgi:hypothetical protein
MERSVMAKIIGKVMEKESGESLDTRVQVLNSRGDFTHPREAILKIGPGLPFFYCENEFAVDVPRGMTKILVERGTEYIPVEITIDAPVHGNVTLDIEMERWTDLQERCWYPGNTHIHYNENETRPDERLKLDPRIEDLRVTVISLLHRKGQNPASNKYPAGVLTDFCTAHHHVECGEESRHNSAEDIPEEGYGHIMLLRLKEIVNPVSRGFLADPLDPDYPPLCYACDDAHRQGGIVIWCHNGIGMEAPVAAALGKLDGMNLFDPFWFDPEYDIWYALLNCGFKLPASTGSDWFISNANRVYCHTSGSFNYEDWIASLQAGNTFVTNGPALFLEVEGRMPGEMLKVDPVSELSAEVVWKSHYDIHQVELIWNGGVVSRKDLPEGSKEGRISVGVEIPSDGWIAARIGSSTRDSFFQPIWAHTSPIYVLAGKSFPEQQVAAAQFHDAIEQSLEWMDRRHKYLNVNQRREVNDLFREGQAIFAKLME